METTPCAQCTTIPVDYHCPITREVFGRGVLATDGFTYEEAAIRQYLALPRKLPARSPMSGCEMNAGPLIPNHTLMAAIAAHPVAGPERSRRLAELRRATPLDVAPPVTQASGVPPMAVSLPHLRFASLAGIAALGAFVGFGLGSSYQRGVECLFSPWSVPTAWGARIGALWLGSGAALMGHAFATEDAQAEEAAIQLLGSGVSLGLGTVAGASMGGLAGYLGRYAGCQSNFRGCYFMDLGLLGAQGGALLAVAAAAGHLGYALFTLAQFAAAHPALRAALRGARAWVRTGTENLPTAA